MLAVRILRAQAHDSIQRLGARLIFTNLIQCLAILKEHQALSLGYASGSLGEMIRQTWDPARTMSFHNTRHRFAQGAPWRRKTFPTHANLAAISLSGFAHRATISPT